MINKTFFSSFVFSFLAIGVLALAANQTTLYNPIGTDNFAEFVDKLINFLFVLSIYVAIIVIAIAGLYMVLSGTGIEQKPIEKAKDLIKYAIWGLIIMILAKSISTFFFQRMGIIKN